MLNLLFLGLILFGGVVFLVGVGCLGSGVGESSLFLCMNVCMKWFIMWVWVW